VPQLIRRATEVDGIRVGGQGRRRTLEYLEGKALPGVDVLNRGVPSRSGA